MRSCSLAISALTAAVTIAKVRSSASEPWSSRARPASQHSRPRRPLIACQPMRAMLSAALTCPSPASGAYGRARLGGVRVRSLPTERGRPENGPGWELTTLVTHQPRPDCPGGGVRRLGALAL